MDRGKGGINRSVAVDADGIPLGIICAPANRHDSPLLAETLDSVEAPGPLPEGTSVHLDRGYDSIRLAREPLGNEWLGLGTHDGFWSALDARLLGCLDRRRRPAGICRWRNCGWTS